MGVFVSLFKYIFRLFIIMSAFMSATLGLNAFKSLSLEQGGEQRAAGENNQNKSGVE